MAKSKKHTKTNGKAPRATRDGVKAAQKPQGDGSKSKQILDLLRRKQGASLAEMQKASGWQSHSVRGFLSGTVKKWLNLKLMSCKLEGDERRYTIAAS